MSDIAYAIAINIINLVIVLYAVKLVFITGKRYMHSHAYETFHAGYILFLMIALGLFFVSSLALCRSFVSYFYMDVDFRDILNRLALADRALYAFGCYLFEYLFRITNKYHEHHT